MQAPPAPRPSPSPLCAHRQSQTGRTDRVAAWGVVGGWNVRWGCIAAMPHGPRQADDDAMGVAAFCLRSSWAGCCPPRAPPSSSPPCRPPRSSPHFSSPVHYRECRHRRRRCSRRRGRRRDRRLGSGSGTTTPMTTGIYPPPPAIAPRPERRARDVAVRCPGGEGGKERECRLRRRREQRRRREEEGGNDGGGTNDRRR